MKKDSKKIIKGIIVLVIIVLFSSWGKHLYSKENKEEIIVFAAASLTESMEDVVEEFEKQHLNVDVKVHLASTSRLRMQIEQGVEAHVFLSANEKHYKALSKEKFISKGSSFLYNSMVLIVPEDNPSKVQGVQDLQKACKLVVAQKEVPAGIYARQIIHSLDNEFEAEYEEKVLNNIVSEENNVKQVVNKVVVGEADAAFVYATDITENVKRKVKVIPIDEKHNVKAVYYIGQLKQDEEKKYAEQFYTYLLSLKGQEIFKKYGFESAVISE